MAHYAKLGLDNIVTAVLAVDTVDCMTRGGIEKEEIGLEHLIKHHGHENWKKCSYNTRGGVHYDAETNEPSGKPGFRANYPGIGWFYNSEYDIFHPPRPVDYNGIICASHTLNTTTGMWDTPVPLPQPEFVLAEDGTKTYYRWDETVHQQDNSAGWVLMQ